MNRELTIQERAILDHLLSIDFPGVEQLRRARVRQLGTTHLIDEWRDRR